MTDQVRFRLLVARTDVGSYVVVYAMDMSVVEATGEDYWDDQMRMARAGWPDEYDYADVTVSVPAEQVAGAFPRTVEVAGFVEGGTDD